MHHNHCLRECCERRQDFRQGLTPAVPPLFLSSAYLFFVPRKSGNSFKVKITTSSPVTVLMSWCRLTSLTPVMSWTVASITGRAVSISWVLTCLRRFLPFSAGSDLTRCCSAAVKTPVSRTTRRSPIRYDCTSFGPRPMYSWLKRPMPAQMAASMPHRPLFNGSFVDDEHFCLQFVALGVTGGEVALVAMVPFKKRFPESHRV